MPSDAGRATWPLRALLKTCLRLPATAPVRSRSKWRWACAIGHGCGAGADACGRARESVGMDEQFEAVQLLAPVAASV